MKQLRLSYAFALSAVIAMVFSNTQMVKALRMQLQSVVLPVPVLVNKASFKTVELVRVWTKILNLDQENERLNQENILLQAAVDHVGELERENQQLKQFLNISGEITGQKTVIARVIGLAPEGFFQTITIDRGSRDGVSIGKPVLHGGFLVGRVIEVGQKNSTVRLITAHNSVIPVILEKSRAKGLLRGGIKGLVVEDIPVDATIESGESILTAGLIDEVAPGISIGSVDSIISNKGDIFQTVRVKTPVNLSQIEVAAVIL